ncbi:MAG: hypothetical protein HC820_05880, partial [Hydrococcus sp. RM1_1_31]|nr:hypothetical protein [Hydrococcus sp. RM1_1_31]
MYSLTTEYNKIFCLPLLPFVLIFGDSRLTYVMSLALVYLVPFCLVMGLLATKIFSTYPYPRQLFWLTAFLTLLMPPTWIAILRGYPDMGGAAIIGLAIFVYLKDVKLRHWWQIPLIGFLLAFAILFRRHFAYGARAFFVAMIVQGLLFFAFEFRSGYKKAFQSLIKYGLAIALVAIASFTTLVIFAPSFIKNILTTNYRLLYASYEKNPLIVLNYFLNSYGELTWLLAFLGFLAIIITRKYFNSGILFTAIFGVFSLLQWILSSKQINIHYNNHFALFIILGIVGFLISIERFFP